MFQLWAAQVYLDFVDFAVCFLALSVRSVIYLGPVCVISLARDMDFPLAGVRNVPAGQMGHPMV